MQMLFRRTNFEDGNCPSTGLFPAPDLEYPELSLVSYVKPIEKYAFELKLSPPAVGLNSCSKHRVSSLRCDAKIKKFDTKMKFKKQMNGSFRCRNLRSIEWYQKTYVKIS
jgi:hypothetical protein